MPEEYGMLIFNVDAKTAKAISKSSSDLPEVLDLLSEMAALKPNPFKGNSEEIDELHIRGTFISLSYECSNWVDVSELIMSQAKNIDYYARHCDEYGASSYFSLKRNGNKIRAYDNLDEDEDVIEADRLKIPLGKWVASLPKSLLKKFPDFNQLSRGQYYDAKQAKSFDAANRSKKAYLYCGFMAEINDGDINDVLPECLKHFKIKKHERYTIVEWSEVSEKYSGEFNDTFIALHRKLSCAIYVRTNFYDGVSPARYRRYDNNGIKTIFFEGDYARGELEYVWDNVDKLFGKQLEFSDLTMDQILKIQERCSLREHFDERAQPYREERESELKQHQAIWADNADTVEGVLLGQEFNLYYIDTPESEAEDFAKQLQKRGMRKGVVVKLGKRFRSTTGKISCPPIQSEAAHSLSSSTARLRNHTLDDQRRMDAIHIYID